jgi:hypothetical protein
MAHKKSRTVTDLSQPMPDLDERGHQAAPASQSPIYRPTIVIPDLWKVLLKSVLRVGVIVLGKKLKHGDLTREGKARCDHLIYMIRLGQVPPTAHIICTGYGGESHAMRSYILDRIGNADYWSDRIIPEPKAAFTRDNIDQSVKLFERDGIQFDATFIVSSEPHIHRVHATDVLVPEFGDFLPLREKYSHKPIFPVAAPYPYTNWADEKVRWLSDVCTTFQWTGPFDTNLYALIADQETGKPHLDVIRRQPVQLFKHALQYLTFLSQQPPVVRGAAQHLTIDWAVNEVQSALATRLPVLEDALERAETALGDNGLEVPACFEDWETIVGEIREARGYIQHRADPDYLL